MHALVTGGAGFIGSHLVDALVARGDQVTVLDDLSTGREENLNPGVTFEHGTVTHPPALDGFDVVFHLAAQVDVRLAVSDPTFDASVNVGGTTRMLELARRAGASRFVLASTGGAIYGEADVVPSPEATPVAPISPYGTSKAAAELYVALYARLHGLSTVALRFANVYGPRQDPRLEGGVVAIFCSAAAAGRTATVFGDGEQTRDFVYVGDTVAALLRAGEANLGGAYNVGTGVETTVNELAALLGLEVQHEAERPGEVRRSALDASRARETLGWTAITGLAEGLALTQSASAG